MSLFDRLNSRGLEPLRFVLTGAVNTCVGLMFIFAAKYFLEFGDIAANALGYGVGLIVSFVLNALWTFRYAGAWQPAAIKFLAAFGVSYACNLLSVLFMIDALKMDGYVAQAIGVGPYTVCFYLLSKLVVFRRSGTE